MSCNQITNTGVNHLCDVLKDSDCKLERLRSGTFKYKNHNHSNHYKTLYTQYLMMSLTSNYICTVQKINKHNNDIDDDTFSYFALFLLM